MTYLLRCVSITNKACFTSEYCEFSPDKRVGSAANPAALSFACATSKWDVKLILIDLLDQVWIKQLTCIRQCVWQSAKG